MPLEEIASEGRRIVTRPSTLPDCGVPKRVPSAEERFQEAAAQIQAEIDRIVAELERGDRYHIDLRHDPAYTGKVEGGRLSRSCLMPARWLAVATQKNVTRGIDGVVTAEGLTILEALQALAVALGGVPV